MNKNNFKRLTTYLLTGTKINGYLSVSIQFFGDYTDVLQSS